MNIIGGSYKNRKIRVPKGMQTRPTSSRLRESLFNICQGYLEGCLFLDLFAGSGAMGLEALSRGAKAATFVDSSKESIFCIKENISMLGAEKKAEVFHADVFKTLETLVRHHKQFDIIYADPPYDHINHTAEGSFTYSIQLLKALDSMMNQDHVLLSPEGDLFIEDSSDALKDASDLQNFVLKRSRQMGRSVLNHYVIRNRE